MPLLDVSNTRELIGAITLTLAVVGGVTWLIYLFHRAGQEGERQRFQREPREGDLAGVHHSGGTWLVGVVVAVMGDSIITTMGRSQFLDPPSPAWVKLRVYKSGPDGEVSQDTWWVVTELRWFPPDTELGLVVGQAR